MSHNLENYDGKYSFAENGLQERAWHGLGQVFDRPMFINEALEACRANYVVETAPVAAFSNELIEKVANGTFTIEDLNGAYVNNAKATIRTDNGSVLGLVSDGYGVVQNIDAFKFVDLLCSGKDGNRDNTPVIETCGVLGKGERIFVTAKFPKQIVVDSKRNDILEKYVTFTTSHDGTGAVRCIVSAVRVVCNNTLNVALSNNSGRFSFRHTSNVNSRLDLTNEENTKFAYKALNVAELYENGLKDSINHLRNVQLTNKMVTDIVAETAFSKDALDIYKATGNVFHDDIPTRSANTFKDMMNSIESGIGQVGFDNHGSGEWLLNGITTYYQNHVNYKNLEVKFDSILDGRVQKKVQNVFDYCMALN